MTGKFLERFHFLRYKLCLNTPKQNNRSHTENNFFLHFCGVGCVCLLMHAWCCFCIVCR
jgi:hypothetical protein